MMFAEIAASPALDVSAGEHGAPSAPLVRNLRPNEILFREGEEKTCLYRVDSGTVALYEPRWDERGAVIDFAFEGDFIGLGFLATHTCSARALGETQLTCLPLEAQSRAIENNPKAQLKLDEAIEREFEYRRACLVESSEQSPLKRLAAFLVSLSRINAHEGRDPQLVGDQCPCGFIADLLGMSVETLGILLLEFEQLGLIEACPPAALRLKDIAALEEIASRPIAPVLSGPSPRAEGRLH